MTFERLPRVTPAQIQSEESVRALEQVLCLPDFILRPAEAPGGSAEEEHSVAAQAGETKSLPMRQALLVFGVGP